MTLRPVIQGFGALLTPTVHRFDQALYHPEQAQQQVLAKLCDRLAMTTYGRAHGVTDPAEWSRLPVVDYDDLRPWVEDQIAQPETAILTPEPILFCEKTSGSRSASKLIPYTRSLRQSFSQMFCIWAQDLITHGPRFATGKVYFCVSPKLAEQHGDRSHPSHPAKSATNTYLQDDSDYLDPWLQWLLRPFLVTLPQVHALRTAAEFKRAIALKLLSEPRLEIISIWSPSFLTVLLDSIVRHREALVDDLSDRGDRLCRRRRDALMQTAPRWTGVWPHLKLISCWDSAHAADSADSLRDRFPGVLVQGKGLLATEAPMTVPLIPAQGQVPLLNQIFFEFETPSGPICRLHELEVGAEYGVIASQLGGLYRYRMGDRVRVTHTYRQTPCLEFLGRSHTISDLVGEKLHDQHVADAIQQLKQEGKLLHTEFISIVPTLETQPESRAGYVLLLDRSAHDPQAIASELDAIFCQSHHYQQARLLGQLAPIRVFVSPQVIDRLTQYRIKNGQNWGDLKYAYLEHRPLPWSVFADLVLQTQESSL